VCGCIPSKTDRLIIFGRYPVPGKTKTRLIPLLGETRAADFQRYLTEKTLKTAKAFACHQDIDVGVCFDSGDKRKMRQWLGKGVMLHRQEQGDLGERMHHAFSDAFRTGCKRIVLIGTDIPELTVNHLSRAFDALIEHDLVLGPSTDGGYWLIGLKRLASVFGGIDWGAAVVFEQTLALAQNESLKVETLDHLTDIDTGKELKKWRPDWAIQRPYLSVIIPALNEEKTIKTAIASARNPDVELIVVDGGSADSTVDQAIQAGVKVVRSPRGRAIQQNRGAEVARGGVFLFLHADTRMPTGYVEQIFETLLDPHTVLGAFRFKTDNESALMRVIELAANFRAQYLNMPYGDQGLFMRRSLFDAIGGFPEVPIAEDLLLARLLSRKGRIQIVPAFSVTSGRRWQRLGLVRTTFINYTIVAGIYLSISPRVLASLYHVTHKKTGRHRET
jgi:rSAM/selenodomain-associated transferase 2/rSAM/selenodomain-associated transferase 1